ncbi:hypothetical protein RHMOL_Rhmol08G0169700 [Rhododendron molle]|uniref:Uncharacterized protein n=1 Tax=Rhododendron molle TaxID=49168 RepID=A0ACC0MRA2_RHOML|nr:hypothetical protein RHMOL_Rhmol08G0169700 [Rhododendron molle]
MSSVVPNTSTLAEDSRCRKPRNQPISETDPQNLQQIPWNTIQSTRPKSSISSLLLSTTKAINTLKKMNFMPPASFRRLGCVFSVSSQVTEREMPANWEGKKKQKQRQRQRQRQRQKSRVPNQVDDGETNMNASSSVPASSVAVPDVGCGPGIGLSTDAAAVDCVVSTRPILATERVDADKMNQRQRASCSTRRMVNPEPMSYMDSDRYFEMRRSELDVFGSRYHRHVRHPSPEGLAEGLHCDYVAQTRVRESGAGVNLGVGHHKLKNTGYADMDQDLDMEQQLFVYDRNCSSSTSSLSRSLSLSSLVLAPSSSSVLIDVVISPN